MLIIKNKSNAPIEINRIRIYPGENKQVPNQRYNDSIKNLCKRGIIGASELPDTVVVNNSQESSKIDPKVNSDDSKEISKGRKKSKSINLQDVKDSIEIPTDKEKSENKNEGEK